MNLNIAALLPSLGQIAGTAGSPSLQPTAGSTGQTDDQTSLQFKMQFDAALSAITGSTSGAPATTGSGDPLQSVLQKKIADLLTLGTSVEDIVTQLSASLATQLARQFGGDAKTIQSTLQTAFATALSPPGTGPPLTMASTASTLAQRFRQVADLAARVSGDEGQSNRLFAGSNLDAVSTAGVQPAPSSNLTGTGPTADSIVGAAISALANLTTPATAVSPATVQSSAGDGKTVALQNAPAIGPNGDTVLGRILARATLSANAATARTDAAASVPAPITTSSAASPLATTLATSGASVAANPVLNAFLRSFSTALAQSDAAKDDAKTTASMNEGDLSALMRTTVTTINASSNASAFMPVQSPFTIAATTPDAAQHVVTQAPYTTANPDSNAVVDQLVRGVFLSNAGSSSDVSLKLIPEALGNVNVKLTIDGGNVSAQVIAQTSDARDALLAGQNQLTRSLADAGIKLTSFNVSLAGGFGGFAQQQQQQHAYAQNTSFGRHLLLGGVDTAENADSALLAVPSFAPPQMASLGWGAFNYLV